MNKPAGALKWPIESNADAIYNVWVGPVSGLVFSTKNSIADLFGEDDYYFDNYFHAYAYFCQLQLRGFRVSPSSYIKG